MTGGDEISTTGSVVSIVFGFVLVEKRKIREITERKVRGKKQSDRNFADVGFV